MASLNAEPALPDEREKQHLPPKSYKDAVEEEAPEQDKSQGYVNGNRVNGTHNTNGTNDNEEKAEGHTPSVLRIVDTGSPVAETKANDRPQFERQESKHEYSATVSWYGCY
jgi:2-acylglycerol O-acyltransferase 2